MTMKNLDYELKAKVIDKIESLIRREVEDYYFVDNDYNQYEKIINFSNSIHAIVNILNSGGYACKYEDIAPEPINCYADKPFEPEVYYTKTFDKILKIMEVE